MPPKGKKGEPSKKTEQKQKQKVIEDKTFGLKNKKGSKQQKYVKMVETQVQQKGKSARQIALEKDSKGLKKDDKKKQQEELNKLFKPVEQKVLRGVDPKSVLCAFFKSGQCGKGDKCKFSHDLNIGRKAEKRSVYDDVRDEDNMDEWDAEKLAEVVTQKHGESNKTLPPTTIICKYFLEAVENSKYGWFWSCPNGVKCHYRHCLPPGFTLKKDQKKEDKGEQISLEELIEKERAALSSKNLTKVTLVTFLKWKDKKKREKIAKAMEEKDKKRTDFKSGKAFGVSGREMFEFNPDLVMGDDDDADNTVYKAESSDDEEVETDVKEIRLDMFSLQSMDGNETADKQPSTTAETNGLPQDAEITVNGPLFNSDEKDKLGMAAALPPEAEDNAAAELIAAGDGAALADVAIDENLFDGDDIFDVDEELENLDLQD